MTMTTEPTTASQPAEDPISREDLDVINEAHKMELEAWRKAGYEEGIAAARASWRTPITTDGGNIQAGEFGDDEDIIVAVPRFIEVEGIDRNTRLTAGNARLLGEALIKAADVIDASERNG